MLESLKQFSWKPDSDFMGRFVTMPAYLQK